MTSAGRIRVAPSGATTLGIDVSAHQGAIDWSKVAASGVEFAYVRAMEGADVDREFARNWQGAKRAGVLRGAYVYFRARHSGTEQARLLLRLLGDDQGELPPALDIETLDDQSANVLVARMAEWLGVVGAAVGRKPVIYSGQFWHWTVGSSVFSAYPLWTPDYTTSGAPGVPQGWRRWTLWQTGSDGAVPGIAGRVDLDLYDGGELALLLWAYGPRLLRWGAVALAVLLVGVLVLRAR